MALFLTASILMASIPSSRSFHQLRIPALTSARGNSRPVTEKSFEKEYPLCHRSTSPRWSLGMATWSNGQAIQEYKDFLATGKSELDKEDDGPSAIVHSSDPSHVIPLTDAINALGNGDDVMLTPNETLPRSLGGRTSYPIYITLPPYELKEFIANLSDEWKARAEDFVFFSGTKVCGVVEPLLREFGMCRDSMTQVVVGFTLPPPGSGLGGVTRKPEDMACNIGADAQGEEKWAGESQACGKWNGAVASRLDSNGIRCKTVFYREWRRAMWERALYDAVWNVVGSVREDETDHADVAMFFDMEASDMMWELANGLRGGLAVTLIYGFEDRLFSIAEMRGKDEPCELLDEMFDYLQNVFPGKCLMLYEYCNYAKDKRGLLKEVKVPPVPTQLSELPSLVKTGNLRADGVI
mmetsp:Transcript_43220/g.91910  ORF Transcript_43220/g.91910 Transcript_43220/m.91910 type:complete len:410 (-) Transcript_43220:197-1426(-)